MSFKKVILWMLVIILGLSLFSCQRKTTSKEALILALRMDPLYLNPVLAYEFPSFTVNSFIFNFLLKHNEKVEVVGDLAESWGVSPDGKTWTFHLKKDVKWHDGTPFTAKDVKFTFDKIYDPKTNTYQRGLFQIGGKNIEFKIIDDYTIQAILPQKFAPFESYLTMQGILPEHLLKDVDINRCDFNINPVGTGPFKFKKWRHSDSIILEANLDYFTAPPKLKNIIFKIMPSREARQAALKKGDVDIDLVSPEGVKLLKDAPHLDIVKIPSFGYLYLGFDLTKSLFKDKLVRQAINYAVDKNKIVSVVTQGLAEPATGPVPNPSWAYTDKVEKYEYNPEKARKLLAQAGWKKTKDGWLYKDQKRFEFEVMYASGSPDLEKSIVLIQSYLKAVGIKVNPRATEMGVLIKRCNPGEFDAVILTWVETCFDPDTCFVEWDSSQIGDKGMNFMAYSNPRVDYLLRLGRKTLDKEKRKKIYWEFQKIVVSDAPYIFLWNKPALIAVNKRVGGLSAPNPVGLYIYPEKIYLK